MTGRRKLAFGVPIMALVLLWTLGIPRGAQLARSEASAGRTALPKAVAPPKGKPEFSATFHGSRLNKKIWGTCYPGAVESIGCTNFGNKEYEWYLSSQVKVSGGNLRLIARRIKTNGETKNGTTKVYGCRSGMVTTFPSFRFKYGFVQVVADVAHGPGLWDGVWMAAANLTFPPEIDLIESWGVRQEAASFFHPVVGRKFRGLIPVRLTNGWQTYSVRWTRSKLTYYVGTRTVLTVTRHVPHEAMYFLANVAEYLKPGRGTCTGQMLIKSVKIWKN